ncbi:saccharopine dehydrogenase family protein [Aliikangiella sp. IMCC44632]
MAKQWMIYGATGYSAMLITQEALKRGLKPVLAGRDQAKVSQIAQQLNLDYRVFSLDNEANMLKALQDIDILLHCAGPFSATSKPMLNACLKAQTHYLDITGEIDVFEYAHSDTINAQAIKQNLLVCPGVGFDVVPTDCLAAILKQKLPTATHLSLAFSGGNMMSPGTAKTTVEALGLKPKVRLEGKIKPVKIRTQTIDFGTKNGALLTMNISWGDVSTAYYSTQIPNIDVYIPASAATLKRVKKSLWLKPLFRSKWMQNKLKLDIEKRVKGPDAEKRAQQRSVIWGKVWNQNGESACARLQTPNGYDVTVSAPLAIIDYLLTTDLIPAGSTTPSLLMGSDFIFSLPNVSELEWLN